jgi:hypothetical protein
MPARYLNKTFLIPTILIALVYIVLVTYLMNLGLVKDTLFGMHTLSYKINLLVALLAGLWTAMTGVTLIILIIISILTGANITLLVQRIKLLKSSGKLHLIVGGGSLLGIVGSGCAACGLPVLGLLGLSGSLVYLPFHGTEVLLFSAVLLVMTLFSMIRITNKIESCQINP